MNFAASDRPILGWRCSWNHRRLRPEQRPFGLRRERHHLRSRSAPGRSVRPRLCRRRAGLWAQRHHTDPTVTIAGRGPLHRRTTAETIAAHIEAGYPWVGSRPSSACAAAILLHPAYEGNDRGAVLELFALRHDAYTRNRPSEWAWRWNGPRTGSGRDAAAFGVACILGNTVRFETIRAIPASLFFPFRGPVPGRVLPRLGGDTRPGTRWSCPQTRRLGRPQRHLGRLLRSIRSSRGTRRTSAVRFSSAIAGRRLVACCGYAVLKSLAAGRIGQNPRTSCYPHRRSIG